MENNSKGLVSIVLPIYNGEKYMRQSIESVINQTYKNWELIIIDDCSIDNTPIIAKEYADKDNRIRYYRNETNLKLPKGLNRGFSLSKGEYLTWTSDDNLYLPSAIEIMVKTIETEKTDFVFAACYVIDENENIIETMGIARDYKNSIIMNNCVGACFMYTRYVYESVGDYNPEMFLVEDYDYWLKIFANFNVIGINDILYKYRIHSGSLTNTKKEIINDACEMVLLKNITYFGNLSITKKYYFYSHLNKLRENKEDIKERKKYNKITIKYTVLYYILVFPFIRIKSFWSRKCN